MNIREITSGDQLTSDKIAVHKRFFRELGLNIEKNGNGIALLIDDFAEKNPDGWQRDIDEIILKFKHLEQEQSLQSALLFLADMIEKINIQKLTALHGRGRELEDILNFTKTIGTYARETLDPYSRIIPSEADNAVSPHWWDQLENEYYGRFAEYLSPIDGATGAVAEKIGKVIG